MARIDLVKEIIGLVGADRIVISSYGDCWPAYGVVRINGEEIRVALFAGSMGLTGRGRDDVERRFQNPSSNRPMDWSSDSLPLLLGLWSRDLIVEVARPVLFAANPFARRGRSTRFSVFAKLSFLISAMNGGWSEDLSSADEHLYAFNPVLLPAYVELVRGSVVISQESVSAVLEASGINDSMEQDPFERARRATLSLVRSARFGKDVVEAYGGLCSMCGLDFGLVEGAHIYPAAAPDAVDEVWNGIALCCNHYAAFDRHKIWIDPDSRDIVMHPDFLSNSDSNLSCKAFVDGVSPCLSDPIDKGLRPPPEVFRRRYSYFQGAYDWVRY